MKLVSITFCLLASLLSFAQRGIEGMVQTERNFAAYAVANSTKEAFLKFADSTGVVFENGQPINAHSFWNKREKKPGILNWRPIFAEVAASGDFGYTTGPWTFQPKNISDSIIAAGYFFTVWQVNKQGAWRFVVDLGISTAPMDSTSTLKQVQVQTIKASNHSESIQKIETDFIEIYKQNPNQAYKKYLSQQSILSREKMAYATLASDQAVLLASFIQPITFIPLKAGIASSGDLGYLYGETVFNGKKQNYLHIWRHEPSGWKIALELIQH